MQKNVVFALTFYLNLSIIKYNKGEKNIEDLALYSKKIALILVFYKAAKRTEMAWSDNILYIIEVQLYRKRQT